MFANRLIICKNNLQLIKQRNVALGRPGANLKTAEERISVGGTLPVKDTLKGADVFRVHEPKVITKPLTPVLDIHNTVAFDEVPGPALLRYVAKAWTVFPAIGTRITTSTVQYLIGASKIFGGQLSWIGGAWVFRKLLDHYGPIVRLHGPFGGNVVILSRPEHVNEMFKHEGSHPIRSSMDSIEKYRLAYKKYKQAGPFVMHGSEWASLRARIDQPLQAQIVKQEAQIAKTCDELIDRIIMIRNRQEEVPPTFKNELYKWSLECLCASTLNRRLGFMDSCGISPTSDPGRLMESLFEVTAAIRKIEYGPHFFKFFESWAWKSLKKNCDIIESILSKHVQRAFDNLHMHKSDLDIVKEVSFLESLILNKEGTSVSDIMAVLLDMMIIGVNSTTHTISYMLYFLAKTPRAQLNLYQEILSQNEITTETLKKMPYLQACIKETLRLHPPIPVLSRVLNKDMVINNFHIPKGTFMLITSHLTSLQEEHFEDASKFKPERWLSNDTQFFQKENLTFASLPFGYGPKGCMAKELAEMQIGMLVSKIVGRFRVEYHYGHYDTSFDKFFSPQKRPLKFRFSDRLW